MRSNAEVSAFNEIAASPDNTKLRLMACTPSISRFSEARTQGEESRTEYVAFEWRIHFAVPPFETIARSYSINKEKILENIFHGFLQ